MDELNFNGIINNLWSKKIQIILIIAIFTVVGVIYTYNFTKPDVSILYYTCASKRYTSKWR